MALKQIEYSDLEQLGFPDTHSAAFQTIAEESGCVISTRTPGKVCEMLLRQGYDAKGFFIKAKSCNWGPMAGFLCLDPVMNKNYLGGALGNLKETLHTLRDIYDDRFEAEEGEDEKIAKMTIAERNEYLQALDFEPKLKTGNSTQIMFNQDRFDWLKDNLGEVNLDKINDDAYLYSNEEKKLDVLLVKSDYGTEKLWMLYYDIRKLYDIDKEISEDELIQALIEALPITLEEQLNREEEEAKEKLMSANEEFWKLVKDRNYFESFSEEYKEIKDGDCSHYVPLMGLTNPRETYEDGNDLYKNAVTGDYDLYAVWPLNPTDDDKKDDLRVAGMRCNNLKDKEIVDSEKSSKIGSTYGNISNRIFMIAQQLNSVMKNSEGPSPNRVFHSDECGRPFVKSADEAVFLCRFSQGGDIFRVGGEDEENDDTTAADLVSVIEYCKELKFECYVNKGWKKDLGKTKPGIISKVSWTGKA